MDDELTTISNSDEVKHHPQESVSKNVTEYVQPQGTPTQEAPVIDEQTQQTASPQTTSSVFDAIAKDKGTLESEDAAAYYPDYSVPEKTVEQNTTSLPSTTAKTAEETVPAEASTVCRLQLSIVDFHGWPIPNLGFRVLDITHKGQADANESAPNQRRVKEILTARTDANGKAPALEGLSLGMRLEFQIEDSQKKHYNTVAIDTVKSIEANACLASPKDKFTIRTYSHEGKPGQASEQRKKRVSQHQQTPEKTANISRQQNTKPSVQAMQRDDKGNPILAILDGLKNMWGVNKNKTEKQLASPSSGKSDIEKVNKLIEFATDFVSHDVYGKTSQQVINEMAGGVYQKGLKEPKEINGRTKGYNKGIGYKGTYGICATHVKIALWAAGYNPPNLAKTQISGAKLAKDMGPDLEKAGFTNITEQLLDARWAAPGDIIVYEYTNNPDGAGHIDIRTYDGYVSDFLETYLPRPSKFKVTGIYRKYYDPLPEKRMRAFLSALSDIECKGIEDEKRFHALNTPLPDTESKFFESFAQHPWLGLPKPKAKNASTAAGAYQFTVGNYTDHIKLLDLTGDYEKFSPESQTRLAIAVMESKLSCKGSLGYIRRGDIGSATTILQREWSSLPGATQSHISDIEFKALYDSHLENELLKAGLR